MSHLPWSSLFDISWCILPVYSPWPDLLQTDIGELLVDGRYLRDFLDSLDCSIMFPDHDRAILLVSPAWKSTGKCDIPPNRSKRLLPYRRTIQLRLHQ